MIKKHKFPKGEFLHHAPCPSCGSSDALAVYSSGTSFCYSCEKYFGNNSQIEIEEEFDVEDKSVEWVLANTTISALPDRYISKEVCEKYGVRVSYDEVTGDIDAHYYPAYKNKELVGFKKRKLPKQFSAIGDFKGAELFGQQLFSDGKMLICTEGEIDCLAVYQMFRDKGKNYRVVSLPNGASVKAIQKNYEWLQNFESIFLCLDNDEPGKKAAEEIAELFNPGQIKIMKLPLKDASDMLREGKQKEFFEAFYSASEYRPDGIVAGSDTWDRIKNRKKIECVYYPEHWRDFNSKTYGIRLGELDTWTSGSGMGKTQIIREIQYHLLTSTESNIGIIALEEPLEDSVEALMALHLNKRIALPDVRETISDDELYDAWISTSGTNRLFFFDFFGSIDEESLVSRIRFLARACSCKYIFLDHLSIVISEFAAEGGERERIDTAMTKLKKLTQELGIWIGLIVHLRKTSGGKSFEEGGIPTLDDLRGSGSIKQLSNAVFALSRNQQAEDPKERNTSQLHILKNRYTGRTGPSDYLYFDETTGRMIEPIDEDINEGFDEVINL